MVMYMVNGCNMTMTGVLMSQQKYMSRQLASLICSLLFALGSVVTSSQHVRFCSCSATVNLMNRKVIVF